MTVMMMTSEGGKLLLTVQSDAHREQTDDRGDDVRGGKLLLTVQSEAHRETGNRLMTGMVTPEGCCCR